MHKLSTFSSPHLNNKLVISNNDCYFYYYSTCTKGENCTFRHEPSALGCEVECSDWLKNGLCVKPHCSYRHMNIEKDRSHIPCFWESQVSGCQKLHCPFMHKNKRPVAASKCATEIQADSINSLTKISTDENDMSPKFNQNNSNDISSLLKKPFSQKKLTDDLTNIHQMISAAKKDSFKETVIPDLKNDSARKNLSNKSNDENTNTLRAEKRKLTDSGIESDQKVMKVSLSDASKVSNSLMFTKRRIILDKGNHSGEIALVRQSKQVSSAVSNLENFVTKRKVVKIQDPLLKNNTNKVIVGENTQIFEKKKCLTQNENFYTNSSLKERKFILNDKTTSNKPEVHLKLTVSELTKEESKQSENPKKVNTILRKPLSKTVSNNSLLSKPKSIPKSSQTPPPSSKNNHEEIEQGSKSPTCLKKFSASIVSASIVKNNLVNKSNDSLEKIVVKSFEQIMEEKKKKKMSNNTSQQLCLKSPPRNVAKEIDQKSSLKPISLEKIAVNKNDSQKFYHKNTPLIPETRRTLNCLKFTKNVFSPSIDTKNDKKCDKLPVNYLKSDNSSEDESKSHKVLNSDLKDSCDVKAIKRSTSVSKANRKTHDSSILDDACFKELGLDMSASEAVFTGSSSDEDDEMLFKEMDMLLS